MATQFQKDYDNYVNQNLGTTNKLIKDKQTTNTNMSNKYVTDQNAIVDKAIANSVNKVQGEIDKLPAAYQSSFDANAIQQKINERQVAERMANMGLTDSGLNRTQQTAINIQRSNSDAALRQQMNAATASLKQQIADLYASGESQKADISSKARYELEQKNQAVYDTYMDNLYSKANAYAENEANNRAAIEKARIEAQQKQEEQRVKWALENGYGYDKNGNLVYTGKVKDSTGNYVDITDTEDKTNNYVALSDTQKSKALQAYIDGGQSGFENYLSTIPFDIDVDELWQYVQSETGVAAGTTFKMKKDTTNGFLGIGGLWGRVDPNDEIEVTYPNGKKETKTISELPEAIQKRLSKLEEGEQLTWGKAREGKG